MWSTLVHDRHVEAANVFRAAYPEDPARAATEIVRRVVLAADGGIPSTDENAVDDDDDLEEVRYIYIYFLYNRPGLQLVVVLSIR